MFLYSAVSLPSQYNQPCWWLLRPPPCQWSRLTCCYPSFNSFRALYSSLLTFARPLLWFCFSILFTSILNSSCFLCSSLVQACSTAVIYSLTGVSLGVITNFGPWASNFSWSSVSHVLERFITHFFSFFFVVVWIYSPILLDIFVWAATCFLLD